MLFVSHNMQTVAQLCDRAVCLHAGRVDFVGGAHEGVARYYRLLEGTGNEDAARRRGIGPCHFLDAWPERSQYRPDEPKRIRFAVGAADPSAVGCTLMAHLVDEHESVVSKFDSRFIGVEFRSAGERIEGTLVIRHPWLKPGDYAVDLFLLDGRVGVVDRFEKACRFQVLPILPYPHPATEAAVADAAVLADYDWELGA